MSYFVHNSRNLFKNGIFGIIRFIFPTTGSIITQANSWPIFLKHSSRAETLLYSRVWVCLAVSAGTPAELGCPKVNAPEPAFTNKESACP